MNRAQPCGRRAAPRSVLALALALVLSAGSPASAAEPRLTIAYTADSYGYVEPCPT